MFDGTLPHTVNTRKAVTRGACYAGAVGGEQLPGLKDVLPATDEASVHAQVTFSRDDEERQIVTVQLKAEVEVECQRCLERFSHTLDTKSTLAIVRDDDQARLLPERYEPLIASEDTDLWDVVAEELALALPVVSYHPGPCPDTRTVPPLVNEQVDGAVAVEIPERPNPFDALSVLLEGGKGIDENGR